jgi:hypothetical protein
MFTGAVLQLGVTGEELMPEVIDKVLVEQPFMIEPLEGQAFGPVDVKGAERVNVRVTLEHRSAFAFMTVDFDRGEIVGRSATRENFGESATLMTSVPVFGPEVRVSVNNMGHSPIKVLLVTVYAVR